MTEESLPDDSQGRRDAPAGSSGGAGPPEEEPRHVCEVCGAGMVERHCKIICLRCGYMRDCSDP